MSMAGGGRGAALLGDEQRHRRVEPHPALRSSALEAQGYEVVRSPQTYGFAAVHAIRVHPDGLDGGADPSHDGIVHGGVIAASSRPPAAAAVP